MGRAFCSLTLCSLLTVLVGLAGPAPARAEETPAERTARVRATFAAPDAQHALHVRLDVVSGEQRVGSWNVDAEPATKDGRPVWRLRERHVQGAGPDARVHETDTLAGADLAAIEGTLVADAGGDAQRSSWSHADGRVVVRAGGKPGEGDTLDEIPSPTAPLPGFASLLLFCRLVPEEPAKYEVHVFDPVTAQVEAIPLDVRGPAMWTAGKERFRVWLVVATVRGTAVRLGFTFPGRSAFVGMDAQGRAPSLVPSADEAAAMPDLSQPATTPEAAAIKQVVGTSSGDVELLRAAFHWPTLHAAAKQRDPGVADDLDAFVERSIQAIREALDSPKPRAEVEAAVRAGLPGKSVKVDPQRPDRAEVALQVGGSTRVVHVARIDDVWYVVPAK